MSDKDALDQIQEYLSGNEWSAETIEVVASIVAETGRKIDDTEN